MSPIVILEVSGLFCRFYLFIIFPILLANTVDPSGVWPGSALFTYDPFTGF